MAREQAGRPCARRGATVSVLDSSSAKASRTPAAPLAPLDLLFGWQPCPAAPQRSHDPDLYAGLAQREATDTCRRPRCRRAREAAVRPGPYAYSNFRAHGKRKGRGMEAGAAAAAGSGRPREIRGSTGPASRPL
jgi:hypothetical protein